MAGLRSRIRQRRRLTRPKPARAMKNKTRFRYFDRFENDPRILSIWDEGDDGLWASYRDGVVSPMTECSADHERTFADLRRCVLATLKANPNQPEL